MVVTSKGRLATSSPGAFLFLNAGVTITDEFGGALTYPGYLISPVDFPTFVGQVVATYTIRDGDGLTATSNITLTVQKPLNRPPDARDDATDVVNGGSTTVPVLLNDSDPDGNALSVSSPSLTW